MKLCHAPLRPSRVHWMNGAGVQRMCGTLHMRAQARATSHQVMMWAVVRPVCPPPRTRDSSRTTRFPTRVKRLEWALVTD